jgi:hypothetical protein
MKKVLLITTVGILVVSIFQSCKKGDNDPLISLKSRKTRLVGEWVLASGQQDIVYGDGSTRTYTYNGSTRVETSSTPETIEYSQNVTINKDETYQWVEHYDSGIITREGYWYFGRKSKELDLKNKEIVCFTIKSSANSSGESYEFIGNEIINNVITWQLDQLKSKQIIVLIEGTRTSSSGTSTYNGTMTYEKK